VRAILCLDLDVAVRGISADDTAQRVDPQVVGPAVKPNCL